MKVAASPHSFLIPLFSLLPLEGGAPKGRRLALDAVFSHAGMPTPPRFARLPLPEEGARRFLIRLRSLHKLTRSVAPPKPSPLGKGDRVSGG